jgi:hypothetical protein
MLNRLGTQDGPSSAAVRLAVPAQEGDGVPCQEDESLVADARFALTARAVVRRMMGSREGSGPGHAAGLEGGVAARPVC